MLRRSLLRLAPLALLSLSCKPKSPAAPASSVITVTGSDYKFAGPDTVNAGLVTFRLTNTGKEPHQMVVFRIDSGKTMADVQAMMMKPDAPVPGFLAFPIGVSVIVPGDTGNATATLPAGQYVMACFIASPDGSPHLAKGMVHPFVVVANTTAPAAEPTADITITEKDYDWTFSAPLTAGTHTIRVENAGPQVHEISLNQLAPGKTLKDFQAWMMGGMKGAAPAKPVGGVTGPDVGGHQFFTATFTAGKYILVCFVPDKANGKPHALHGMVKGITVS